MAKKPAWWQLPTVIGGVVFGLGAIGTGIITASHFLTLPDRVEAGEKKNAEQDKLLDRLTYIAEQNQQLMTQQMRQGAPSVPPMQRWTDRHGVEWCCVANCEDDKAWERCSP